MNAVENTISYLDDNIYKPNGLFIQNLVMEQQNKEYEGCTFTLNGISIRHRTAKITPKKSGQFVAIWEKDEHNQNKPFSYDRSPELLVINTFTKEDKGQFIFPKEVLRKKGILFTKTQTGKMAFRVYPSWDTVTSKQAMATQKWQLTYFVEFSDSLQGTEIRDLYGVRK